MVAHSLKVLAAIEVDKEVWHFIDVGGQPHNTLLDLAPHGDAILVATATKVELEGAQHKLQT